jgi:hypothetical protein
MLAKIRSIPVPRPRWALSLAALALATASAGCGKVGCFQISDVELNDEQLGFGGECPARGEAIQFFSSNGCSAEVKSIDSDPERVGEYCCYDISKYDDYDYVCSAPAGGGPVPPSPGAAPPSASAPAPPSEGG